MQAAIVKTRGFSLSRSLFTLSLPFLSSVLAHSLARCCITPLDIMGSDFKAELRRRPYGSSGPVDMTAKAARPIRRESERDIDGERSG